MTVTFAPAATPGRCLDPPRRRFPRLAIGAWLKAMFDVYDDAIRMAYVEPYAARRRQPEVAPDDVPEGRDPSW